MHRIIPILTFVFLLLIVEAVNAQQGIGTNTPDRSAAVEIKSASRGLLIPRVALMATNVPDPVDNPAESLMVYNIATTDDVTPGYYYWKKDEIDPTIGKWMRLGNDMEAENGLYIDDLKIGLGGSLIKPTTITLTQDGDEFEVATAGHDFVISGLAKAGVQEYDTTIATNITQDHLLAVGNDNIVKALKAAMPKFFYMPSVLIPTAEDQIDSRQSNHITFHDLTGEGEIDLYAIYAAQFGSPLMSNPTTTTTLPVLPANELDYYITWYDDTVFDTLSIEVSDTGILTYKVITPTEITMGTFMNIVFAVKP